MWKFSFKKVLSGDILTESWLKRQYKLIALISVLIFIYIHSGYKAQCQQKELNEAQKELQDVKFVQLTINAELMATTRQSSITNLLEQKGSKVKPNNKPAIRIQ